MAAAVCTGFGAWASADVPDPGSAALPESFVI
jgi:hypothetical protein